MLLKSVITNAQTKIIFGGLRVEGLEGLLRKAMSGSFNLDNLDEELEKEIQTQNPLWQLYRLSDEIRNLYPQTCLVSPFIGAPIKIKYLPSTEVSQERLSEFEKYIFAKSGYYSHFQDVKKRF